MNSAPASRTRTALACALLACTLLACMLLAACGSGGPVRRVSEPAVNIQQLTVHADGGWSVDLRIDNFSSIPMRFDAVRLALAVDGQTAGTLQATPSIQIGPEAADVVTTALTPSPATRIAIADALSQGRSIEYTLDGSISATPEKSGTRDYAIKRNNSLNPVPGLAGVLR